MEISPLFFAIFAGISIVFSLSVVFRKSPVSSAFSLVMVFFAFAGIYAMLGAHLVAALQILVYAGAIMVLFVFVIMLLNEDGPDKDWQSPGVLRLFSAAAVSALLVGALVWTFKSGSDRSLISSTSSVANQETIDQAGGNTRVLSRLLFSDFVLPFELTSILLLAAIVGAVALAKRNATIERSDDASGR